jgi:hypothetical protein
MRHKKLGRGYYEVRILGSPSAVKVVGYMWKVAVGWTPLRKEVMLEKF